MRIGSLFSGAGGLDLAALQLFPNSSMAWHAEIDPAASRVLAHHWPEVPNLGDVSAVDWSSVEPVDVLAGGFPCQDISAAGRRRGLAAGTRSGLWSYMRDAIEAMRPRWVLIENVRGLLSAPAVRGVESAESDMGDKRTRPILRALGAVLGDLAELGFDADWTCVRASDIGACHRRERVFVLAYPAHASSDGRESVDDGAGGTETRRGRERIARGSTGSAPASIGALLPTPLVTDSNAAAPGDLLRKSPGLRAVASLLPTPEAKLAHSGPDYARAAREGSGGNDLTTAVVIGWGEYASAIARHAAVSGPAPSPTELNSRGNPRLSARFAEWMMFWRPGWVTDPAIGLSRSDQLRCIGNGVVPPQAVAGFRHLLAMSEAA